MTVFHTSPNKIEKIHNNSIFKDCLFFSLTPYSMSFDSVITYSIELADTIDVSSFFYREDYLKLNDIVYPLLLSPPLHKNNFPLSFKGVGDYGGAVHNRY